MKNFLLKSLGFFLLLVLVFGGFEWALRRIPNDYNYKATYYRHHDKEIKIWNVGSSHAYYGINPDYFEKTAFNGAHVSQSLDFDLKLLRKYIRRMDSLEVFILPVSYFSLFSRLEKGAEAWRCINYSEYPLAQFGLRKNLRIFGDQAAFDRAKEALKGSRNDRSCLDNGMGSAFRYENRYVQLDSIAAVSAARHKKSLHRKIMAQNESYIKQMARLCQKHQTKLILLSTPVHQSYYQLLDSTQLAITRETCHRIAADFPHCHYLDWMQDERFVTEDFFDADHLNHQGAIKLTQYLNDFIRDFSENKE